MSGADLALAEKARISGTAFKSRSDAVTDFRAKYATTYATRFPAEPKVRPEYIPQTIVYGGQSVRVIYDRGGYGYYYGGVWRPYDPFLDDLFLATYLPRHNYYYGDPVPVSAPMPVAATAPAETGYGWVVYLLIGAFVLIVVILMVRAF